MGYIRIRSWFKVRVWLRSELGICLGLDVGRDYETKSQK